MRLPIRSPDLIRKRNAELMDTWRGVKVAAGDGDGGVTQGGFGTSRATAAGAVSSILRRGPEGRRAEYSVVCVDEPTAPSLEAWDAAFTQAGARPAIDAARSAAASLVLGIDDERLAPLSRPQEAAPPNPLVGPLAATGPYWGTLLLFIYGFYITTTPDYIATTGVDLWGIGAASTPL